MGGIPASNSLSRTCPIVIHQLAEIVEQIAAIVRPGDDSGDLLHAEQRHFRVAHAFQSAIIQIDVRQFHVLRQTVDIDCEAVVLRW